MTTVRSRLRAPTGRRSPPGSITHEGNPPLSDTHGVEVRRRVPERLDRLVDRSHSHVWIVASVSRAHSTVHQRVDRTLE